MPRGWANHPGACASSPAAGSLCSQRGRALLGAQRHAPVGDTLSRYGRGGDPRARLGCRGCEEEKGALSAGSPRPCTFIEVCVGISPARGGLHFLSRFMSGSSIKRLCGHCGVALSERPGLGALGWGGGARSQPRCRPRGRYRRLSRRGYRDITGPAPTWRRRHFRPAARGRG